MTYKNLIPAHGGYKKLASFKNTEIIYDATAVFCKRYKSSYSSYLTYKLVEQMLGAARSGKQNIAEGSVLSGTSKKSELKLLGVAKGSLVELAEDYGDFLRIHQLPQWPKTSPLAQKVRLLVYQSYKSYTTYKPYIESNPACAANTLLCLIYQTTYLLDRQIHALGEQFKKCGGFTEKLYRYRSYKSYKTYT